MRTLGSIVWALALAYLAVVVFAYLFQGRLVYFPTRELAATPADRGFAYEPVALTTRDGLRLDAWFLPVPGARGVLLFCHGNAGNISHRLESLAIFRRLGLSTLIFDYRGYGRSQGRPSEQGTYEDAAAAWHHLVEERGIDPRRIVLFGRSLGAAVAARLASQVTAAGLIMESAFTSVPDFGQEVYPWLPVRLLARLHYDSRAALDAVRMPVLIVHSRADEIVPFHHGERLYRAAHAPKRLLEIGGDHNSGFLTSGERYSAGLGAFLAEVLPP